MACYIPRWYTRPKTVTHPGTNRAKATNHYATPDGGAVGVPGAIGNKSMPTILSMSLISYVLNADSDRSADTESSSGQIKGAVRNATPSLGTWEIAGRELRRLSPRTFVTESQRPAGRALGVTTSINLRPIGPPRAGVPVSALWPVDAARAVRGKRPGNGRVSVRPSVRPSGGA